MTHQAETQLVNLTKLPSHVRAYVETVDHHLITNQRVIRFKEPLSSLNERDIVALAHVLRGCCTFGENSCCDVCCIGDNCVELHGTERYA